MIELRLIRHAMALARLQNFARAAEAVHLTQPSLSRSIAALEKELGVRLFDRTSKSVELTVYGRLFLDHGAALLAREADLRRELDLLTGLQIGTLVVGAAPYPTEICIGPAVVRLMREHPQIRVRVITSSPQEIARRLLAGEIDVGVASVSAVGEAPEFEIDGLGTHDLLLACRPEHPLARKQSLTVNEVLAFPLVSSLLAGTNALTASGHLAAGTFDAATKTFVPALLVDSFALARQIARDTDALFPATASMLADSVASGHLVALDFHLESMQVAYGVMTLRDRSLTPAARTFVELLGEVEMEVAEVDNDFRRRLSVA